MSSEQTQLPERPDKDVRTGTRRQGRLLQRIFANAYCLASYPELMGKVLGIVYRTLATHIIHKAGFTNSSAHTGAVTLIQRFGSALNLKPFGANCIQLSRWR